MVNVGGRVELPQRTTQTKDVTSRISGLAKPRTQQLATLKRDASIHTPGLE